MDAPDFHHGLLILILGASCLVGTAAGGAGASRALAAAQEPGAFEDYTETIPGMDVSFRMIALPGSDPKSWISQTEVTWDEYELFYFGGVLG